jgi:guanylate kinase
VRPIVVVLTGPSGVGKDAVVNRMRERGFAITRPATMTTRTPRDGEVHGEHHLFVSEAEFLEAERHGELLEHARVYGNLYGVPRSSVRRALESGDHVVIRVDIQGAETLRHILPDALFLALEPASPDALRGHLEGRGSESPGDIDRRLAIARDEIERARQFCTPVVNPEDDLDATVDEVWRHIEHESARTDRAPLEV